MLHWIALFLIAFPHRTLVLPLHGKDHAQNARHNDETLAAIQLFIREHGSIARGKAGDTVRSDTIAAVGSTFRAYRQVEAGYRLRVPEFSVLIPTLNRQIKGQDGPTAARKLELGVGPAQLDTAYHRGFDWTSERGKFEWAICHTLIQVVGRGGEPGLTDDRKLESFPWNPSKDCVVDDVKWLTAEHMGGRPALDFWWFPIKDPEHTKKKVPIRITRTHDGPLGSKHLDPYDAIWAWWRLVASTLSPSERKTRPLFSFCGVTIRTRGVATIAKKIATSIGEDPALVGAKSFRIAGATRIYEEYDLAEAEHILTRRGRWCSEIKFLYARLSSARQVEVSRRMALVGSTDMERSAGWTQPVR